MRIQDQTLDRLVIASYLLEMGADEVWKEIDYLPREETESRYFVSNYGSVISLCRNKPIILQPFLCGGCGSQYYYVSIGGNDYRINRLVAQAFIPNPENKPIVHHKDHNKLNNHYSNLEWATPQENAVAYQEYKASNTTE
jgi:hypothetical protein